MNIKINKEIEDLTIEHFRHAFCEGLEKACSDNKIGAIGSEIELLKHIIESNKVFFKDINNYKQDLNRFIDLITKLISDGKDIVLTTHLGRNDWGRFDDENKNFEIYVKEPDMDNNLKRDSYRVYSKLFNHENFKAKEFCNFISSMIKIPGPLSFSYSSYWNKDVQNFLEENVLYNKHTKLNELEILEEKANKQLYMRAYDRNYIRDLSKNEVKVYSKDFESFLLREFDKRYFNMDARRLEKITSENELRTPEEKFLKRALSEFRELKSPFCVNIKSKMLEHWAIISLISLANGTDEEKQRGNDIWEKTPLSVKYSSLHVLFEHMIKLKGENVLKEHSEKILNFFNGKVECAPEIYKCYQANYRLNPPNMFESKAGEKFIEFMAEQEISLDIDKIQKAKEATSMLDILIERKRIINKKLVLQKQNNNSNLIDAFFKPKEIIQLNITLRELHSAIFLENFCFIDNIKEDNLYEGLRDWIKVLSMKDMDQMGLNIKIYNKAGDHDIIAINIDKEKLIKVEDLINFLKNGYIYYNDKRKQHMMSFNKGDNDLDKNINEYIDNNLREMSLLYKIESSQTGDYGDVPKVVRKKI